MTTLTLLPEELRDLVGRVLPFASKDWMLPTFCAVAIVARDGRVTATATDRYTIGVAKVDKPGQPDVTFSISATHWRQVLSLYPAPRKKGEPLPVTLTVDDEHLTTSRPGAVPEVTARFPLVDPEYLVKGQSVLSKHLAAEPVEEQSPTCYNPTMLARFAHLGQSLTVLPSGPKSPTVVLAHDFAGALMPMSHSADAGGSTAAEVRAKAREDWTNLLTVSSFGEVSA